MTLTFDERTKAHILRNRVQRDGNTVIITGLSGVIWEIRDYAVVYGSRYEWGFNGEDIKIDIQEPMTHDDPTGLEVTAWSEENKTMLFNQEFEYKKRAVWLSAIEAIEVEDGIVEVPYIEGLQCIESDDGTEYVFYLIPGYYIEYEGRAFNWYEPLVEVVLKEDDETMELEDGYYKLMEHLTPDFKKALYGGESNE